MITETNTRRIEPGITIFSISGRLTLGNALMTAENDLRRLVQEGARKVIVDLTGLISIDSSGIGMLVSCFGHMEQQGGRMRIAGVQEAVSKILNMVHIDRIVPVDADVESSSRHLTADAASA